MKHRSFTSSKKTVKEVEDFIMKKTNIDFKISKSSLNGGSTLLSKGLNNLTVCLAELQFLVQCDEIIFI